MCPLSNNTYQRLIRARALIDESYAMPLDLEQLAGAASFSRYYFRGRFHLAAPRTALWH